MTPDEILRNQLSKVFLRSGMTQHQIADKIGVTQECISAVKRGRAFPSHELVMKLAEALQADGLVTLSIAARTKTCHECQAPFVDLHPQRIMRSCTPACRQLGRRKVNGDRRARAAVVTKHRLTLYQETVAAYCKGCAPDGVCWDTTCSLRPVSPLVRNRTLGG